MHVHMVTIYKLSHSLTSKIKFVKIMTNFPLQFVYNIHNEINPLSQFTKSLNPSLVNKISQFRAHLGGGFDYESICCLQN